MTEVEQSHQIEDFLNTGRTGRRNAMADVLDTQHSTVSTGDLPFELEKLSCSDSSQGNSGSGSQPSPDSSKGQGT